MHGANSLSGAIKSAVQVHIEYTQPSFVGDVSEGIDRANARVVHQHIDAAKGGHHFVDQRRNGGTVAHIQAARDALAARTRQSFFGSRQIQVERHHNGALGCKTARNGPPHALTRSGDQRYFVFQSHFHLLD